MHSGMNDRDRHLKSYLECDFSAPSANEGRRAGVVAVLSPAKINWTLRVLGRRADGYHEIESLVSPVSLYDELSFSGSRRPGIRLTCDTPGVPLDKSNLIVRAARLLAEAAQVDSGVECWLVKRIPIGGGLGGGSSNAASTLLALSRLWNLNWSTDRLAALGAQLGSDVPLFLHAGPIIMRGRGERVEPVRLGWRGWVVLVFPTVSVSTADVYKTWRPEGATGDGRQGGRDPHPPERRQDAHPPEGGRGARPPQVERFATAPAGAVQWMEWTFNMLEAPAMEVCPVLKQYADRLRALAGRPVRVSGSGSTLFTAFDDRGEAERFAGRVTSELGLEAGVVRPIARACGPDGPAETGAIGASEDTWEALA
jgi:4-diphosphocytidyl-2C-methyl-D-erythritol kinase